MLLALLTSLALAGDPAAPTSPTSPTAPTSPTSPTSPSAAAPSLGSLKDRLSAEFGQPSNHSGVRTGLSTAGFSGEGVVDSRAGVAEAIGVYKVSKLFFLWSTEPELTVTRRNVKALTTSSGTEELVRPVQQTWLELPFLIRTKVPTPKFVPPKPYAVAGPYFALRVGGNGEGLAPVDLGWYVGGGTEVYLKDTFVLGLDTRGAIGRLDLQPGEGQLRNKGVLVSANLAYVPKKKRAPSPSSAGAAPPAAPPPGPASR